MSRQFGKHLQQNVSNKVHIFFNQLSYCHWEKLKRVVPTLTSIMPCPPTQLCKAPGKVYEYIDIFSSTCTYLSIAICMIERILIKCIESNKYHCHCQAQTRRKLFIRHVCVNTTCCLPLSLVQCLTLYYAYCPNINIYYYVIVIISVIQSSHQLFIVQDLSILMHGLNEPLKQLQLVLAPKQYLASNSQE